MRPQPDLRAVVAEAGVSGRSLALVMGPLGGGDEVCRWLLAALGHQGTAECVDGVWSWPGGRVRDFTTGSPIKESSEPGTTIDVLATPPPTLRQYYRLVDLRTETEWAKAWFAELFPGSELAQALAPAGRLVSDALRYGITAPRDVRVADLPSYRACETHLMRSGGARFLDFARVMALIHPRPVHVGDEWVRLANHLGGRNWSVADLSLLLMECGEAFVVRSENGVDSARFSTPFLLDVVAARVPASTSEHYTLFRALRDMAVQALLRSDPGDEFVAKELPLQALAGDAVEEMCDDGMALLAADPQSLIDVVENPRSPVSQGSKLVLQAAHRLGHSDTLSQLELAARRAALLRLADQMSAGSPARQWRAVWATSQPVNTNRVLLTAAANVLCLASLPGRDDDACVAGLSSGQVWEVSPRAAPRLVWQDEAASEVRCLATALVDGQVTAFTGHSNQTVRAISVDTGATRWVDSTVTGPLSAIATTCVGSDVLVAVGGVDGVLLVYRGDDGTLDAKPVELGAEIRGIRFLQDVIVTCLVDGTLSAIDRSTGALAWRIHVPGTNQVCNALDAIATASGDLIVVGTASGGVYEVRPGHDGSERTIEEIAQLGSSVNVISTEPSDYDTVLYVGLADGSWVRRYLSDGDSTSFLGHVGSVNALVVARRGRILTGAGEGTVRSWLIRFIDAESVTLEWGVRHRGPVTAIRLSAVEPLQQLTGGADGSLRSWTGPADTTGTLIADHDSPVRALAWDGHKATAYVGHADGLLRAVQNRDGRWEASLIGIQHDGITGLALAPDGTLFSAGVDGTVTRWHANLMAGAATRRISDFGHVSAIDWLEPRLIVGGQDGTVTLLEPSNLVPIMVVELGPSVVSLAGNGRSVFAGLADGSVVALPHFGHLDDSEQRRIRLHNGAVRGLRAFELSGNLVLASTGLDRRLVVTDLRSNAVLADVALDGFGLGVDTTTPLVAVSTTSGAMVLELSTELPGFLSVSRPRRG